jgi:hypothetical protein
LLRVVGHDPPADEPWVVWANVGPKQHLFVPPASNEVQSHSRARSNTGARTRGVTWQVLAKPPLLPHTVEPVVRLLCGALGGIVAAYLLWTWALARSGVNDCRMIYNFMPVVTMGLGTLQGATPTIVQVIGALVVIVGATLSALPAINLLGHRGQAQQPAELST